MPQTVRSESGTRAIVERSYLLLTEKEVGKAMGHKLRAKDPSLRAVSVQDIDGTVEKCFVFIDDERPHRKLVLQSLVGEQEETLLMQEGSHLHSQQGELTRKGAMRKRLTEAQLEGLWAPGSEKTIVSLQDYKAKLQEKYGDAVQKSAPKSAAAAAWEQEDKQLALEDMKCVDDDDDDADDEERDASLAARADLAAGLFQAQLKQDPGSISDKKKRRRTSSSRSLGGREQCESNPVLEGSAAQGRSLEEILQTADQYLSDEERVRKWCHKIPIEDTLWGEKLGIQKAHAEDCCKKMAPAFAVQLKSHLRLYYWARALSPDVIGTSTGVSEAHEAIDQLASVVERWPPGTLSGIFKMNADKMIMQLKSEAVKMHFERFYTMFRPFAKESEVCKLDPHEPRLWQLELTEGEKLAMFSKYVIQMTLVDWIMAGESSSQKVLDLMVALQGKLKQELEEEDLTDAVVNMIADLNHIARCMQAILSEQVWVHLKSVESVSKLKRQSKGSSGGPLAMVANSMQEVPWYMDKLTTWIQTTATIKLHRQQLDRVDAFRKVDVTMGPLADRVVEMKARLQDLSFLQLELDMRFLKENHAAIREKLEVMWGLLAKGLGTEAGQDLSMVQALLAAASECYPEDEGVEQWRCELGSILKERSGRQKIQSLLDVFLDAEKQLSAGQPLSPEGKATLEGSIEGAAGLAIPEVSKAPFHTSLKKVVALLQDWVPANLERAQWALSLLKKTSAWAPEDVKAMLPKIETLVQLCQARDSFQAGVEDVPVMIKKDEKWEKLSQLMRTLTAAERILEEPGWIGEKAQESKAMGVDLRDAAQKHLCMLYKGIMIQATVALQPCAGGMSDGTDWKTKIVEQDWSGVLATGKETLLKADAQGRKLKYDCLQKALEVTGGGGTVG